MSDSSSNVVPLVGRVLIALIFVFAGLSKLMTFGMMTAMAAQKGMPFPALMIGGAATVEILGGLAVLTGFHAKIAGWILFVFLIPTTLIFHNFWALQGAERVDNQAHFMKNLAIMGGLLFIATFGGGAYSLDSRRATAS